MKIKLGFIGAGRIAKVHAQNIMTHCPNIEIKAISDIYYSNETMEWIESMGIKKISKEARDIFEDEEISAVFICSSTDTHCNYIKEAANHRKHIFCEKPIGLEVTGIIDALKSVEESKVILQIGFVRRFDHNHTKVMEVVRDGKIGKAEIIKICSRDPVPPTIDYIKSSGGLITDCSIHDFDMARYLSGSEVIEVSAIGAVLVNEEIGRAGDIDTVIITLRFKNGALGVIDLSRRAVYGHDQRTEVHCSKGCVRVENDTNNTAMIFTEDGVILDKPKWWFMERYADAFVKEVVIFIDALNNNRNLPPVNGWDGLVTLLIVEAAYKSLLEGRIVNMNEIYEKYKDYGLKNIW